MPGAAGRSAPAGVRRILANLDAESELARTRLLPEAPAAGRDPFALSGAALEAVAAWGTLLRALAGDRDRLWLPARIDPSRLAAVPGLPAPAIDTGPLDALSPAAALLAWAETPSVAALRQRDRLASPALPRSLDGPLRGVLWAIPPADPAAVLRVSDRALALEMAEELGCALPGARLLASVAELETHLAGGGASASPADEWVLKAPVSAAGRWRHRGRGRFPLEAPARRAVENLFERFGRLLFEPWLERTADFGCAVLLAGSEQRLVSLHRQEVDGHGRCRGVLLEPGHRWLPALSGSERDRLSAVVEAIAVRLRASGYRGPFTIDLWRHRGRDGQERLHPLGELNPRMSLGLVARALAECLPASPARVRLRLGTEDPRQLPGAPGVEVVPLLLPGDPRRQPAAAWLECHGGRRGSGSAADTGGGES